MIVAFRSAKAAFFRGAKGDTCFCTGPWVRPTNNVRLFGRFSFKVPAAGGHKPNPALTFASSRDTRSSGDKELNGGNSAARCSRTVRSVRSNSLRGTSPRVTQYFSVRHGTRKGSRVIVSRQNRISGFALRNTAIIRGRSRKPSPKGTSA